MALVIGNGVQLGGGISLLTDIPYANLLGSTASTATPTFTSGSTTSVVSSSPFSGGGNSYNIPIPPGTNGNNNPTGNQYEYFTVPGGSGYSFGSGDFTIEWFENLTTVTNFPRRFMMGSTWGFDIEGSTAYWLSTYATIGTVTQTTGVWNHFAIVRISGTMKLYKNGSLLSSASVATSYTDTSDVLTIGGRPSGYVSEQFVGKITSFRVIKGLGVYTGNFTTPTSSLAQTAAANPYGGSNTSAITAGQCTLLLNP